MAIIVPAFAKKATPRLENEMVPSQLGAHLKKWEAKHPYLVPSRGPNVIKKRGLYFTFVTFWIFFVFFGFSSAIFSIFIDDFIHGFAF